MLILPGLALCGLLFWHEKIFIARNIERYILEDIERILSELKAVLVRPGVNEEVKAVLKKHVRHYEAV